MIKEEEEGLLDSDDPSQMLTEAGSTGLFAPQPRTPRERKKIINSFEKVFLPPVSRYFLLQGEYKEYQVSRSNFKGRIFPRSKRVGVWQESG